MGPSSSKRRAVSLKNLVKPLLFVHRLYMNFHLLTSGMSSKGRTPSSKVSLRSKGTTSFFSDDIQFCVKGLRCRVLKLRRFLRKGMLGNNENIAFLTWMGYDKGCNGYRRGSLNLSDKVENQNTTEYGAAERWEVIQQSSGLGLSENVTVITANRLFIVYCLKSLLYFS